METPNYTARVIDSGGITGYIDIQPPVGAISENFLSDFGADNGTTVKHELTTAATTRLSVTIKDELLPTEARREAFKGTATYILQVLTETDRAELDGNATVYTAMLKSTES